MKILVLTIAATLCAGHWSEANAKCGFLAPCRAMHVTVLSCELDAEVMELRRRLDDDNQKQAPALSPSPLHTEITARDREFKRLHSFDYKVIARIERVIPLQCPRQFGEPNSRYLPLFDFYKVYPSMFEVKKSLVDSIGGRRMFTYSGSSMFECANLARARELAVQMNDIWCEGHPDRADNLTNVPFAWIESFR